MAAEKAARERVESGEAAFVPISLKASPVEIELPNGGIVRLPLGVGHPYSVYDFTTSHSRDGPYVEWRGPQEALSEDGFWRMGAHTLGLGTNGCCVVFHSVRVQDVSAPE